MTEFRISETLIGGLRVVDLKRFPDSRGWFQEAWHQSQFEKLGLANFKPVQLNVSQNLKTGTTRGLHAEPWNKLVTVTNGSAFGAWVDLREGDGFGRIHHLQLTPGVAVYVPRGVANAFQTTSESTTYVYLVDDHWSDSKPYKMLDLFDAELSIPWPTSSDQAVVSEKDLQNPRLSDVSPFLAPQMIVIGGGQLGKALANQFPNAKVLQRSMPSFDHELHELKTKLSSVDTIINAAAYTNVNLAEDPEERQALFDANYRLVRKLCEITNTTDSTLVHFSSDYVFGGEKSSGYSETDEPNPLNQYGLSKLLGDLEVQSSKRHYLIRTSWVFGDGNNFVRTMASRAASNLESNVVSDQFGRPTSTKDLARFVNHLVKSEAPYGTYNLTGSGDIASWFDVAKHVYGSLGLDQSLVKPVSSGDWESSGKLVARRPKNSHLDLAKAESVGFQLVPWRDAISGYLDELADSSK